MGGTVDEFKCLSKAIELDTEWFRGVSSQLSELVGSCSPNGRIIPVDHHYGSSSSNSISDSTFPCAQCGMVTPSRAKHVLNWCERFKDRYRWRKNNILYYMDSLLDHNTYQVFCNLPDRRTAAGGTIPGSLQPANVASQFDFAKLVPDIVATDRSTEEVHIFVLSVPHETDAEMAHAEKLNQYHHLVAELRRSNYGHCINFHALEVGSASGHISACSRVALYALYKLSLTSNPPLDLFMANVSQLAKLSSFKIFKTRHESKPWVMTATLYPSDGGRVFVSSKRNLLRKYIIPAARAGGCVVAFIAALFLLYLSCRTLKWVWSQMTSAIVFGIFMTCVAACLSIFRP